MKNYIFQIDNVSAGNEIVVANAQTGLAVKNILAIINKTTGKPVHSPIAQVVDSVTYNGTTMTITLDSNAPSIEGDLLIKCYKDGDDGGGGGIEIMTDDEYEPALSDLENMLDDINVTDEN